MLIVFCVTHTTVVRQICCPFVLQIKCLLCLRNNTSCVTLFVPTSSHYTKRESNLQIKYRQDSLERLDEFTVADCLHHDIGIDQSALLLSPINSDALQSLLIRRGVPSAAFRIASMAASSKMVW